MNLSTVSWREIISALPSIPVEDDTGDLHFPKPGLGLDYYLIGGCAADAPASLLADGGASGATVLTVPLRVP